MRAGLGLAVLGAVVDIGYHLGTDAHGIGHGSVAVMGHTVTPVGMVVTMPVSSGRRLPLRVLAASPNDARQGDWQRVDERAGGPLLPALSPSYD